MGYIYAIAYNPQSEFPETLRGIFGLRCNCNVVLYGIHFMVTKIWHLSYKFELISDNVGFPLDRVITHQITFLPRH